MPDVPGYQAPEPVGRGERLWWTFLAAQEPGQVTLMIAAIACCAIFATRGGLGRFTWDIALLGILAIQIVVWMAFTHQMPPRFMAPAAVPLSLIAAGGLARLLRVKHSPFDRDKVPGQREGWGILPAITIYVVAVAVNLLVTVAMYPTVLRIERSVPPVPGDVVARDLPPYALAQGALQANPQAKFLLVGDAAAFYYPAGTIYATCFDEQLPDRLMRENANLVEALRDAGVTHVLINWAEVWRLAGTYGLPATLTEGLYEEAQTGRPPSTPFLRRIVGQGARAVRTPLPTPPPAVKPTSDRYNPFLPPPHFPYFTVLAIPPADAKPNWTPEPIEFVRPPAPQTQPTSAPATQPAR